MAILGHINRKIIQTVSLDFSKGKEVKKISDYLDESLFCFLEEQGRDEALKKLVDAMYFANKISNKDTFYKAIMEREKIVSTGIGLGVAIPHAKIKTIDDFSICIGLQKVQGLPWNAIDGNPVRIIFMIAGPENRQTEYLQILSKLTNAIKREELRKKLLQVPSRKEALRLFSTY